MKKTAPALLSLILIILTACTSPLADLTDTQLQQQEDNGNGAAQYTLAQRLAARKNYPQAMQRLQQAADSQSATRAQRAAAALQAGDWYQQGLGEARNQTLALHWWRKAAALGDTSASERLGEHCRQQHSGKLADTCMDDFSHAAKHGNLNAQKALAQWYSEQNDHKAATQWLQKAADQGDPQSEYRLAQHYEQGKGTDKLPARARQLYRRAAEQAYPAAIAWMAAHSQGTQAVNWHQKAAQTGDPASQLWLAQAYLNGSEGLQQSRSLALYWLQKALNGGSAKASYQYSKLQTRDDLAQHYLHQAAKRGWPAALRELAQQYTAEENYPQARKLWQQLAQLSDPQAQRTLADFQRQGLGGKADPKAAVTNYRLAAQAGDHTAQYRLGLMYQQGLGIPRNRILAYAWYALAAVTGNQDSVQALNTLEKSLSQKDISTAQQLALRQQQRIRQRKHPPPPDPPDHSQHNHTPEEP